MAAPDTMSSRWWSMLRCGRLRVVLYGALCPNAATCLSGNTCVPDWRPHRCGAMQTPPLSQGYPLRRVSLSLSLSLSLSDGLSCAGGRIAANRLPLRTAVDGAPRRVGRHPTADTAQPMHWSDHLCSGVRYMFLWRVRGVRTAVHCPTPPPSTRGRESGQPCTALSPPPPPLHKLLRGRWAPPPPEGAGSEI